MQRLHSRYGVTGKVYEWLKSYLTERSFTVQVANGESSKRPLLSSVSQGSILGPTLFAMYVAPPGDLIREHGIGYHMYADDNQLYITFKVTFLLAKRFSDLDNPDCLDFRANRNKNLNKIDPYTSCLLQSSSQFQRIVFYFFLLNQASRGETERKLALYLVVVHTGFRNLKLSGI